MFIKSIKYCFAAFNLHTWQKNSNSGNSFITFSIVTGLLFLGFQLISVNLAVADPGTEKRSVAHTSTTISSVDTANTPKTANTQVKTVPFAEACTLQNTKLVNFDDAIPFIIVSVDPDAGTTRKLQLDPRVQVTLNALPTGLDQLEPGDSLLIKSNRQGKTITIDARRSKAGIIAGICDTGVVLSTDYVDRFTYNASTTSRIIINDRLGSLNDLKKGDTATIVADQDKNMIQLSIKRRSIFAEFWENFRKNLFKPLLLFFYMGFCIPLLRIAFEFPYAIYRALTIYLLISIGWHGGEELAVLSGKTLGQAVGFIMVGFSTNLVIGLFAYIILRSLIPQIKKVDAATIAGYYGSDSAGTFVTCVEVLQAAHISYAAYMPVMLAVMEIPGCLVALFLVSRLRKSGQITSNLEAADASVESLVNSGLNQNQKAIDEEQRMALEVTREKAVRPASLSNAMREVFFNPGLFLLFGGITVGYISRLQGTKVVQPDDQLFVALFQGFLCLFLLEMGMTASKRLHDLKTASWKFIVFGLAAPNLFATFGMSTALIFSHIINQPFQLGTYVLFAVLCGAASYIAVPAIQRLAIPEASPTLPLAASLGLTFSYNVTIGIPVYIVIAQQLIAAFPVAGV